MEKQRFKALKENVKLTVWQMCQALQDTSDKLDADTLGKRLESVRMSL